MIVIMKFIQYIQTKSKGFGQMLFFMGLIILVIAVSFDSLGVGISYGMRKIHVPMSSLFIIMLCSGMVVMVAMSIGHLITQVISPQHASMLGGIILILLGLFSLGNAIRAQQPEQTTTKADHQLTTVLMSPDQADWDQSGIISPYEALLLGFALSLDAFGSGICASIIGYSPFITALSISLMSGLFVFSGLKLGLFLAENKRFKKVAFIAPFLLIILGIINIF